MEKKMKQWMPTLAVCGLLFCSTNAHAVMVQWTATGRVTFSTVSDEFLSSYMPEFLGVARGDEVVLNLTFDTDATLSGALPYPEGGTTYYYDDAPVVIELRIDGRGTHVFGVDQPGSPDIASSLSGISLDDDTYKYQLEPPLPVDAMTLGRNYRDASNTTLLMLVALFGSTNSSIFNGPDLPRTPHPDLTQDLAQLTIYQETVSVDPSGRPRMLGIAFRDLFASPSNVPEPGTLAMLGLGLAGLGLTRRRPARPTPISVRTA